MARYPIDFPCCCGSSTEPPPEPIMDACDDCFDGLPFTLNLSVIHQTTSLNSGCGNCDAFFASLVDVPIDYQGTIVFSSNTYHLWRSETYNPGTCGGVFDNHVFSLLIRTINPGGPGQYCQALAFFHDLDDTSMTSTSFGYRADWGNLFYFGSENTVICAEPSFYMGCGGSADTSFNCLTIPFMEYDLKIDTA